MPELMVRMYSNKLGCKPLQLESGVAVASSAGGLIL